MGNEFDLEILASDHLFFRGKATNLVIPVTDGFFGILAHHDDIVVCMVPGTTHFDLPEEGRRYAVTGSGIVMMRENKATILVDFAERPEDVDEKRARLSLEQAREKIRQKRSIEEYRRSQATLARAMARLSGKHITENLNS